MALSEAEIARYARQIVLHEVGGAGQQRLKAARVLVIGAGGLGSPAILYLAAAGVGTIGIVDDDAVSLSNLQRQILHGTGDVGRAKAASAVDAVARANPFVAVEAHETRLGEANAAALIGAYDMVLDGSDNFDTRYRANRAAVAAGVPLVAAALGRWEGQVGVYDPAGRGGPCYQCVFPERPAPGLVPACAEAGVLGALAGILGAMQAAEAMKLIVGAGRPLVGRLLIHDALEAEARVIETARRPGCPVCGHL